MEIIGWILMAVGGIMALIYSIIVLIKAFQTSIWWGIGSLLIGLVGLIFVIMHWDRAGKPFLMSLAGMALVFVGAMLMPGTAY